MNKSEITLKGQERVWAHFQTSSPETFEGARPRLDRILRDIGRKKGQAGAGLLNIGAGEGYLEARARKMGWQIHCLDPDPGSVAGLRRRGIPASQGYIQAMPFAEAEFSFVVASEVLEHLAAAELRAGLAEVRRVLQPGGWLLGTVPYAENLKLNEVLCPQCGHLFHRWGHRQSFDEAHLARVLGREFANVRIRRRAFVSPAGRGPLGLLEDLVRVLLARAGARIASTRLYFEASK